MTGQLVLEEMEAGVVPRAVLLTSFPRPLQLHMQTYTHPDLTVWEGDWNKLNCWYLGIPCFGPKLVPRAVILSWLAILRHFKREVCAYQADWQPSVGIEHWIVSFFHQLTDQR